ncbi:EF-hand_domain-containing protein [Hexamita inflata]|uniref:EF-hand domain-containing protein n=1 Tax=Hexamita inflata TaxID=28002 RepID=A0AA86TJ65_9EUKA|nr:EF-hand domain-containing protein [Hexamita inflata]CAI9929563.1 EF-hand domain-containing protein [Hexamita inflata]CAI9947178.1 EF-hand domain-containing protein [Hexamita inflata]
MSDEWDDIWKVQLSKHFNDKKRPNNTISFENIMIIMDEMNMKKYQLNDVQGLVKYIPNALVDGRIVITEEIFLQLIYVLHYADLNNIIQVCFYMTDKGMQNELTYDQFKDFLTMIGVPIQDKHKKYISKLAINGMYKYAIVMDFISNLSCTQ